MEKRNILKGAKKIVDITENTMFIERMVMTTPLDYVVSKNGKVILEVNEKEDGTFVGKKEVPTWK